MHDLDQLHNAARARRDGMRQRVDRPRERESRGGLTETNLVPVNFRSALTARAAADGSSLHFNGLASAYEQPYEMFDFFGPYTEVVSAGAGAKSIARSDLDVPLVLQHNQLRRIARTTAGDLTLTETDRGLEVDAPSLDPDDQDVAYIVPKIRNGHVDEMSFAFRITRGSWSPDYTEYRIDEYDIHRGDVAIVGYGANPNTVSELRTQPSGLELIDEGETRMLLYL